MRPRAPRLMLTLSARLAAQVAALRARECDDGTIDGGWSAVLATVEARDLNRRAAEAVAIDMTGDAMEVC